MMKMKRKTLFEMFVTEYVEIVQDYEITTSVNMTEEGHASEIRMPMMVTGFVLDSDGEFLFLSQDGEEVNQAIPISSIKNISIASVTDSTTEALDNIEPPEGIYN